MSREEFDAYLNELLTIVEKDGFAIRENAAVVLASMFLSSPPRQSVYRPVEIGTARLEAASHDENPAVVIVNAKQPAIEALIRAKQRIEDLYNRKWRWEDIAKFAGYSKFDFIRSFTREFGVSPHQFLIRVRAEKGLELLRSSHQTIAVVAKRVGFGSASAMRRAFCKIYGGSPANVSNNIGVANKRMDETGKTVAASLK